MEQSSRATLPDDVDALKGMIVEQGYLIAKLKSQLERMRRHQFGAKSEGLDQLELLVEELETAQAEQTPPDSDDEPAPPKGQAKRKALPDHLLREEIVLNPQADCAHCGKPMRKLADNIREMLDYVPGRFVVRRFIRPKLSCRDCGTIAQAPLPSMPIEKGVPGPGLLAHVLTSKFADHLPLYRQSQIYARDGVNLDVSTMADWVGRSAALLDPLIEAVGHHVFAGAAIHTDDTPVPVLDPGRGKTKTGRLWTYVRDERPYGSTAAPAAFYKYSNDRKGMRPREHLKNYKGFMHADGYAGYDQLYGKDRITEVACLAHVRRKFFDIYKATGSPVARQALEQIAALYAIEKEIRGSPPDNRRCVRRAESKPLFERLQAWLDATLPSLPGRSELAKAMRYAITRLKRLAVYLGDGRLEIDNNAAERSMRGAALGRKNWLFAGSARGGTRAAAIMTLIETAKLNNVDPQSWLTDVIDRIADHPIKKIEELLPWNWHEEESGDKLAA